MWRRYCEIDESKDSPCNVGWAVTEKGHFTKLCTDDPQELNCRCLVEDTKEDNMAKVTDAIKILKARYIGKSIARKLQYAYVYVIELLKAKLVQWLEK